MIGRRAIVTAASELGVDVVRLLVDAGAEVHVMGTAKPEVTGIASFSECDLESADEVDATVGRIGKVVNNVFVTTPISDAAARHLVESVLPLMILGGMIVTTNGELGDLATPDVRVTRIAASATADAFLVAARVG